MLRTDGDKQKYKSKAFFLRLFKPLPVFRHPFFHVFFGFCGVHHDVGVGGEVVGFEGVHPVFECFALGGDGTEVAGHGFHRVCCECFIKEV